jgi:membrane protein DedA with SNARE-associated domain
VLLDLIDRLAELPLSVLYPALAFFAAIENVIPPLPTDAVVAFGSFLAARGHGSAVVTWLVTWSANIAGASAMYLVGRHYGHSIFNRALVRWGGPEAEHRLAMMYQRYGVPSLFVSRFLPGIRALVPVFAGAARLPFVRLIVPISLASGLWYGFLAFIAYRAAADWETLQATISQYNRGVTVVAVLTVAGVLGVWLWRRRRATWTPDVTRQEELNREVQQRSEEEGGMHAPSRDAGAR